MNSTVRNDRLPVDVLDNLICKINPENDFKVEKKPQIGFKSEIKVENYDDLNDPIYKESVSIHLFSLNSYEGYHLSKMSCGKKPWG